jgi:phage gp16-like protein
MSRAPSTDTRRAMLAKVHIAKKDLCLDDDTYRMMLDNLFGVESSAKLSLKQLDELLGHMTSRGFVAVKKGDAKPSKSVQNSKPIITKIGALLVELGQREGRHMPWSYAVGILKRQSGVMRLEWAKPDQLRAVVAALDNRVKKLDQDALLAGAGDGHAGPMPF